MVPVRTALVPFRSLFKPERLMIELTSTHSEGETSLTSNTLPIGSIVRALCHAANAGPDLLYEVMLKLSLPPAPLCMREG